MMFSLKQLIIFSNSDKNTRTRQNAILFKVTKVAAVHLFTIYVNL